MGRGPSHIHSALGCVGVVTDGSVRDLDEVRALKFQFCAAHVSVSHANVHMVDFGIPVKVGGVWIKPGDLVHADQHGVVTIPHEIAPQIPEAIAKVEADEKKIITVCQSKDFTPDKLKALYQQIRPGTLWWGVVAARDSGRRSAGPARPSGRHRSSGDPEGTRAGIAMIEVRLPRIADAAGCAELAALVIGEERAGAFIRSHMERHHLVVAEADGQIVGFLAYRTDWFQCTFVTLVVVREEYRRKGIAREFFKSVEVISPTPRLFSSTEETNGVSIRMHTALGFTPSGHVDNLPQGTRELLFYAAPTRGSA